MQTVLSLLMYLVGAHIVISTRIAYTTQSMRKQQRSKPQPSSIHLNPYRLLAASGHLQVIQWTTKGEEPILPTTGNSLDSYCRLRTIVIANHAVNGREIRCNVRCHGQSGERLMSSFHGPWWQLWAATLTTVSVHLSILWRNLVRSLLLSWEWSNFGSKFTNSSLLR